MRRLLLTILALLPLPAFAAANALVRLPDRKEVEGTLINREITLHAPYGPITVSAEAVARVHFAPGSENDVLLTTAGNRFSGFIHDIIQLDPPAGAPAFFKPFELDSLSLNPIGLTHATRFLVLINGDILSGDFTLPSLAVTNASGASTLSPQDIDSVWFVRNEQAVDVQLTDGRQMRAAYPQSALTLKLDSGGEIEIPRQLFRIIYWRTGSVPPEVTRLVAATQGTNSASTFPAPERMVWIPPGTVVLGSPLDERGRNSDEDPRTHVTLSRGFWMGQYEVTQGEYEAVMGENPSTFQGDTNRPIEKVSWHDANDYCARLTLAAREAGTLPPGYVYRLPTEAEWEYACRAGTTTRFSFGDDPDERELRKHAWFVGNSEWSTHPVGQLEPNPWGLYDMHGNVLEWCAGIWSQSYPGGQVTDYKGPPDGWLRVARGGSWVYDGAFARSANRDDYGAGNRCSDVGFRVVLAAPL